MGSESRSKVMLLIPHCGGGGAEHVATTLASYLSPEKYEVHLGLVTQSAAEAENAQSQFPSSVRIHGLGARRIRGSPLKLLKLVWRIRPDLILSGMAHLNLLVLWLRPFFPVSTRVLVRQNGALDATLKVGKHPRISFLFFRLAYRRANLVICQTSSMADDLLSAIGVEQEKLLVLPNPVDLPGIRACATQHDSGSQVPGPRLLTVGRLASEKGIDLLLGAFERVRRQFPTAVLQVAGTGPCEIALRSMCSRLGIDDSVQFAGHVTAPARLYGVATVFVLASRHEGLPNALLEAAAAGLPIVATPASRGLRDLLRNQPGIWLARDVSATALEDALVQALKSLRRGQRFEHAWIEAFDRDVAVHAYEEAMDRFLQESRA